MTDPTFQNTGLSRQLGLRSLTLAVVTGTIGSGWLFAPFFCAKSAGPGSLIAWLIGGTIAFSIALVYAELGALVSSSGALAQIPLLTHGRMSGFVGGWCVWIAYVSLPTIEVMAIFQYLASSFPWLTLDGGHGQILSTWGIALATMLLVILAWINLSGIGILACWIDGLTAWKLLIPLLVSVTLMLSGGHWGNLSAALPGMGNMDSGIMTAVSTGGVLFSLMGFRTAMDLAGETKNPQRDVPLAMALGLGICLLIYLVLQLAFLVAVSPEQIAAGWDHLNLTAHGGPLVAIALGGGLIWVANLLLVDAVVSPSATAMAYMGVSGRVSWMMGRCGLLPNAFERLNRKAVPWVALFSSLVIGIAMLFSGPSWQKLVAFLSATLVMALAMGPVSLMALRYQLPATKRPFRLIWAPLWCRVAFVFASWATIWCGRPAVEGAAVAVILPSLVFLGVQVARKQPMQISQGLWWFPYVVGLVVLTEVATPRHGPPLPIWLQLSVVAAFALIIFPYAVASRLRVPSTEARLEFFGASQESRAGFAGGS
jgi:amino acid transporter